MSQNPVERLVSAVAVLLGELQASRVSPGRTFMAGAIPELENAFRALEKEGSVSLATLAEYALRSALRDGRSADAVAFANLLAEFRRNENEVTNG